MLQRKPTRLKEFDYSQTGYYFITICAHMMIKHFGKVINGEMQLNNCGNIVKNKLEELAGKYPYFELDEYVVMPNHVHAIFTIDKSNKETTSELSPHKIKSLSELVGVFKTTSSKEIHQQGLTYFKWQRSFYDRVIRNEKKLYRIRNYIQQNPLKWEYEKNIIDNLEI